MRCMCKVKTFGTVCPLWKALGTGILLAVTLLCLPVLSPAEFSVLKHPCVHLSGSYQGSNLHLPIQFSLSLWMPQEEHQPFL